MNDENNKSSPSLSQVHMDTPMSNMENIIDIIHNSQGQAVIYQDVLAACFLYENFKGIFHEKDMRIKAGNVEIVAKSPHFSARLYNIVIKWFKKWWK